MSHLMTSRIVGLSSLGLSSLGLPITHRVTRDFTRHLATFALSPEVGFKNGVLYKYTQWERISY